jgi:hypothetical protein
LASVIRTTWKSAMMDYSANGGHGGNGNQNIEFCGSNATESWPYLVASLMEEMVKNAVMAGSMVWIYSQVLLTSGNNNGNGEAVLQ